MGFLISAYLFPKTGETKPSSNSPPRSHRTEVGTQYTTHATTTISQYTRITVFTTGPRSPAGCVVPGWIPQNVWVVLEKDFQRPGKSRGNYLLGCPTRKLGLMVSKGLCYLWMGYIRVVALLTTTDPNFLAHPSRGFYYPVVWGLFHKPLPHGPSTWHSPQKVG